MVPKPSITVTVTIALVSKSGDPNNIFLKPHGHYKNCRSIIKAVDIEISVLISMDAQTVLIGKVALLKKSFSEIHSIFLHFIPKS